MSIRFNVVSVQLTKRCLPYPLGAMLTNWALKFLVVLSFLPNILFAQSNLPSDKQIEFYPNSHFAGTALSFEQLRVSIGVNSAKLMNPEGFDVESEVYEDGLRDQALLNPQGEFSLQISAEKTFALNKKRKKLLQLNFDKQEYKGLKLTNGLVSIGAASSPLGKTAIGLRYAGGVGAGLSHAETYFDQAYFPAAEIWVSVGAQLGVFTIDLTVRERTTLRQKLDERDARVRTQIIVLSYGLLF